MACYATMNVMNWMVLVGNRDQHGITDRDNHGITAVRATVMGNGSQFYRGSGGYGDSWLEISID